MAQGTGALSCGCTWPWPGLFFLLALTPLLSDSAYVVHPGRHVCMEQKQVQSPAKEMQTYCKPSYKKHVYVCEGNRLCTTFRVVYQIAYREVMKMKTQTQMVYACCPGWTQYNPSDNGCMKPECNRNCQNGGQCTHPDKCTCPSGWTGKDCEQGRKSGPAGPVFNVTPGRQSGGYTDRRQAGDYVITGTSCPQLTLTDVNECDSGKHGCHQKCVNTEGSYECRCNEGYNLTRDGKSCQMCLTCIPEYKDFVDGYQDLTKRVKKLEKEKSDLKENMYQMEQEYKANLDKLKTEVQAMAAAPAEQPKQAPQNQVPWDRIASLSEQIGLLEERLEVCTCSTGNLGREGIPGL